MILEILLFVLIAVALYAPVPLLIAGGRPEYFSKLEFGLEVRSTSARIIDRLVASRKGTVLLILLGYVPFSFLPLIALLIFPPEFVTELLAMNFFIPTMLLAYIWLTGDYLGLFYQRRKIMREQRVFERAPDQTIDNE